MLSVSMGRRYAAMTRRSGVCVLASVAAMAALVGVSLGAPGALAQEEKLRVGKGFPSLFQFTPLDVGIETGIFKKHGLDVEASAFTGDAKLQQAFAAGAVDLGIGSRPGTGFLRTR